MRIKRNKRLRFHLGKGENYMKWQLRNKETDEVEYYNPSEFVFSVASGKLNNRRNVAKQIYEGSNKTVCSWISFDVGRSGLSDFNKREVMSVKYNPRVKPYWTLSDYDCNLDGYEGEMYILNKEVFITKDGLDKFINKQIQVEA